MSVKLISITKGVGELSTLSPEELIVYVARVSNQQNQLNMSTAPKLIEFCIRNKHWSVFEHCNLTLEIVTSRMVSTQILRHKSFSFAEFSQRYAKVTDILEYGARKQDLKNRQNSTDDLPKETKDWFSEKQKEMAKLSKKYYEEALEKNIAKECARVLLPMGTKTTLYISGTCRSFITYLLVRLEKVTQLEHQVIAKEMWEIFQKQFPNVGIALKEVYPDIFA